GTDGTDVLYYGERFHVAGRVRTPRTPIEVADTSWFNRLPLPWYTERADATTESTLRLTEPANATEPPSVAGTDAPVVVIAAGDYRSVREHLGPEYEGWTYELTATNTIVVVFVDTEAPGFDDPA
ncbi:TIGR03663 family protein, partial [Halobacterium sp. CBA1126]|nr:TIGR03663 family protein [Halobacterium sp. CBA1126]